MTTTDFSDDLKAFMQGTAALAAGHDPLDDLLAAELELVGADNISDWQEI